MHRVDEAKADPSEVVRSMVTGVDVKGQMFRHSATVLFLNGNECTLLSKSQPEIDSSILVEFDYPQADPKGRVSQGRVKSNHAELLGGTYKVVVELEVVQPVKVVANRIEIQTPSKQPSTAPVPIGGPQVKGDPASAPRESRLPTTLSSVPQVTPPPNQENGATKKIEVRESLPKAQAEDQIAVREAVKSAVASEIKQQMLTLRSWISSELEKAVPLIVSSSMERMVSEAVEKKISVDRQTILQAVNSDVARQIGDRIAESDDLRTALAGMANKLFEEQKELSRSAGVQADQDLSSRATTTLQSIEKSLAEMEARVSVARVDMEQVGSRIAESDDLRAGLASMAKKLFEEQMELSRSSMAKAEQDLSSRATMTMQAFEKSLAEMEARVNVARVDMERVGNRIAESNDLRVALESAVNRLFEEQTELSRTAGAKVEEELRSRATTILQSFEGPLAEMEARIRARRSDMEVMVTRTQTLRQEIEEGMLPLQETLERLNHAERAGIEQFQRQADVQLRASASQFENQLTDMSAEKAVQFSMKIDAHLASHRQRADEAVDKLGAVLQLMQGTVRVQKEKLTEHSLATAANFEKEIRAILLRLAGGA
jgi:hypothetical protein